MTDKELLAQVIQRSIDNVLNAVNPTFRMFSPTLTNYAMSFLDPYINAFMNPGTEIINTDAAEAFLREETSRKIEEFMKRFNNSRKEE